MQASVHNTPLYYRSGHHDDQGLKDERGGKGRAAEWREQPGSETEDEAAETEGRDREEGFDPAVGFRG